MESLDGVLAALDARLRQVLGAERRRAERLAAGGGGSSWDAMLQLTRPSVAELLYDESVETEPLVPRGAAPFAPLARALHLPDLALDALLLALAPHIEPRYRAIFDVLAEQPTAGRLTPRILLAVLGRTPDRAHALRALLAPDGVLLRADLLVPSGLPAGPLGQLLDLAPAVAATWLGLPCPADLDGIAVLDVPGAPPSAATPTLAVHGPGSAAAVLDRADPGVRRLHLAPHADARALLVAGRALILTAACRDAWPVVDLSGLDAETARRIGTTLHHHARRCGTPLALRLRDPAPWDIRVEHAPRPTWAQRRAAWQAESARHGAALSASDAGFLATASRLPPERLAEVFASSAHHDAPALAAEAARLTGSRLPHGTALTPTRTFDDLVLVDTTREALERLLHFVRNRDRLADARGLEHRFRLQRGPIALFSGLPGTGKTLSAEVIAHALGRPLHVVDLSRLVSKYIGETEKHIDEVLTAGEDAGAVLLFDEADSLFAKRTDVSTSNDRFANLEVGYLLQRIEHHDGLVILSTNLRRSVDDAFLRRFHSRIEFPLPSAEHREQLWSLMLPPAVPRTEDLDTSALARTHRLSGGEIRNAALKAIFIAEQEERAVSLEILERAVAIELLELGRLSRRPERADDDDLGAVARIVTHALSEHLEQRLGHTFLKEVHLVHGAPTKEALSGKRPAASLAVYQLVRARSGTIKLGLVASAWCARAEEEQELLGVLHEALGGVELPPIAGQPVQLRLAESFDFDLLHRFWSSHGQPLRGSVVLDVIIGDGGRRR